MDKTKRLLDRLSEKGKTLAAAESCTGGLLGKKITDLPGSSAVFRGGVVAYCNDVKRSLLDVSCEDLDVFGAVSEPVAWQMAEGVRRLLGSSFGVGITGIAGPASDDTKKPVGLVFIGATDGMTTLIREFHFQGDRTAVREQACAAAVELLLGLVG